MSACEKQWQQTLSIWKALGQVKVEPNVFSYSAAISSYEKCERWWQSWELFNQMSEAGMQPNVACFNGALSSCGKGGEWPQILTHMEAMMGRSVLPNLCSFTLAINLAKWQVSLWLLLAMPKEDLHPNAITFGAMLSSYAKSGNWQRAWSTLCSLKDTRARPNLVCCNALIASCEVAGEWQRAMEALELTSQFNLQPDAITFSTAISSCQVGSQWEVALHILHGMPSTVRPNVFSFSAAISSCKEQWQQALNLVELMLECEVEPNHVSLNAVLSSLEKGHRWQEAWSFLNCMPVQPDVISFTYAIKACQDSQAWQVGYILRLEGAKALLDAQVEAISEAGRPATSEVLLLKVTLTVHVTSLEKHRPILRMHPRQRAFLPLDDFFSVAAGRGMDCFYNDKVLEWKPHVPVLLRPFALTPPLVMPCAEIARFRAARFTSMRRSR
ncbi:unnamed protein product [Durusdinium trenchii]|uniref:Pentatricopeptide repeat-containing protein, chloroplastic n=1 Tax=Durusdinium trenchii TaxID=1381693 RepID=A0ABP0JIP3_9DINO